MNGLTTLATIPYWPVWIGMAVLVLAMLQNDRFGRIPNEFTFGTIFCAWAAAVAKSTTGFVPTAGGEFPGSIACTFLALGVMLPAYGLGCAPAGCVKSQMALGAWLGCGLAWGPAGFATVAASVCGLLLTAAAVTVYQLRRRAALQLDDPPEDFSQPPALFPIQATLSLGSLAGIIASFALGLVP